MTDLDPPPDPLRRPKLARWLWDRDLKPANVAAVFGCAPESVRRYCLPFNHEDRRLPGAEILERIVAYTQGAVTAADFYPPHLNGAAEADAQAVQP